MPILCIYLLLGCLLRNNKVTRQHWNTLSSRVSSTLRQPEIDGFANALRIYGQKEYVNAHNHKFMRDCLQPILSVNATHEGPLAEKASFDQAGNLHKQFPICVGARVMLLENIWTERGLVNGALGTVDNIIWPAGTEDARASPSQALLIAFGEYGHEEDGPYLYRRVDRKPVVPIFRSRRDCFTVLGQKFSYGRFRSDNPRTPSIH